MSMKRLFGWLWGMALVLAVLLSAVSFTALDKGFYARFYESSDLSAVLDVPNSVIESAMDMMLDYVSGESDTMAGTLPGIGEVYNEKEKAHMEDVRALYEHAMTVCAVCWGFVIAGFLFALWKKWLPFLFGGYLNALCCFFVLVVFLGFWMATGFDDFWTHFHQLFFDNDLWLLDPATDFMIRICPASLFSTLIWKIVFRFLLAVGALALAAMYGLRRMRGTHLDS